MRLLYTGGGIERWVEGAEVKLRTFRDDSGYAYLRHEPCTPRDELRVEDLAVTLLMNSQVTWRNATSVSERAGQLDLSGLPDVALEDTTDEERRRVANVVGVVASWPGFGASTATKTLHKKRPALIPILDNLAIFGAYLHRDWGPGRAATYDTVKDVGRIGVALDQIHADLNSRTNEPVWPALSAIEPGLSRVEIFDSVWWIHFRGIEPRIQPEKADAGSGAGPARNGWTVEMRERQRKRMKDYYEANPEARERMRQIQLQRYAKGREPGSTDPGPER
jgi:Family of unknown function (DUF6308)